MVTESKYKTSKVKNALFAGTYVILFTSSTFSEVQKIRKSPVTRQPLVLRFFKPLFHPRAPKCDFTFIWVMKFGIQNYVFPKLLFLPVKKVKHVLLQAMLVRVKKSTRSE